MSKSSHDHLQPSAERPTISLADLPEIKRSYEKAKAAGEEQFLFKGASCAGVLCKISD